MKSKRWPGGVHHGPGMEGEKVRERKPGIGLE